VQCVALVFVGLVASVFLKDGGRGMFHITNAWFKHFFRMDHAAFEKLCKLVGPHLEAKYNLEHRRAGSVQL
jgi:hypothetical protein